MKSWLAGWGVRVKVWHRSVEIRRNGGEGNGKKKLLFFSPVSSWLLCQLGTAVGAGKVGDCWDTTLKY